MNEKNIIHKRNFLGAIQIYVFYGTYMISHCEVILDVLYLIPTFLNN